MLPLEEYNITAILYIYLISLYITFTWLHTYMNNSVVIYIYRYSVL